jgi:hypothetical protein
MSPRRNHKVDRKKSKRLQGKSWKLLKWQHHSLKSIPLSNNPSRKKSWLRHQVYRNHNRIRNQAQLFQKSKRYTISSLKFSWSLMRPRVTKIYRKIKERPSFMSIWREHLRWKTWMRFWWVVSKRTKMRISSYTWFKVSGSLRVIYTLKQLFKTRLSPKSKYLMLRSRLFSFSTHASSVLRLSILTMIKWPQY